MEIQKADPRARRKAVIWLVVIAVAGGLLIAFAESLMQSLIQWVLAGADDGQPRILLVLSAFAVLLSVPAMAVSWTTLRVARRTLAASRFPPPDFPVWRNTRILRGRAARLKARFMQFLVYILLIVIAAAIYQAYGIWQLFQS